MTLQLDQPLSRQTLNDIQRINAALPNTTEEKTSSRIWDVLVKATTVNSATNTVGRATAAYAEEEGALVVVGLAGWGGILLAFGITGLLAAAYNLATGGGADEQEDALDHIIDILTGEDASIAGGAGDIVNDSKELAAAIFEGNIRDAISAGIKLIDDVGKEAAAIAGALSNASNPNLGPQNQNGNQSQDAFAGNSSPDIFSGNDFIPKTDPLADTPTPGSQGENQANNNDSDDDKDDDKDDDEKDGD
jgi:hypothetical protein